MAINVQKGGHRLFLYSRSGVKQKTLLKRGGIECSSRAEVAKAAEFIITMVPNRPDVEEVLFGENGVAAGLTKKGKLVMDMSAISLLASKEFAARVRKLGSEYLDASVSGGDIGVKNATLTIMVEGSEAAFERAKPLFELMGKNITCFGKKGDGQTGD
jgi:2-hydroxy-3-oxopropionate reductase